MYDDIAYNVENPRRGVIINHPDGKDVYKGVPKVICISLPSLLFNLPSDIWNYPTLTLIWQDYVGDDVTAKNFLSVILGNKKAVKGGSGKVVNSGPNDHVFIYYADHGGPGVLGW